MNPNPTTFTDLPTGLSNLLGAYDQAHWETEAREIKSGQGVLQRGSVLASGSGADVGKLVKLTPSTEAAAYGVLLDEAVDTSVAYSEGSVTGSIVRAGSFRGAALLVPNGVDAGPDRCRPSWSRHLRRRLDRCSSRRCSRRVRVRSTAAS